MVLLGVVSILQRGYIYQCHTFITQTLITFTSTRICTILDVFEKLRTEIIKIDCFYQCQYYPVDNDC